MRREVARHAGAEVKTEGDSFYVVFPSGVSALDCAVAILRRADAHNRESPDAPLELGVGLHAGETVAYDDQFVGSAVNIASRLASKAQGGELVVSDTLRGLVRTGHSYELVDRGALRLKGVSERVRAWSVVWQEAAPAAPAPATPAVAGSAVPRAAPTGQLLCPILIGREPELSRIAAARDNAARGAGALVLVAGEAGVGKSAFVRESAKAAIEAGSRLLHGAALEGEAGLPYGPLIAAVRSAFRDGGPPRLRELVTAVSPELIALFPELGRAVGRESTSTFERYRVAAGFEALLRKLSEDRPLLVVLDDLHWSDEATLALIQHLAREIRVMRVLILGTYRSDELHRKHPLTRTLASLRREALAAEIALGPLTPEEIGLLIQATFERPEPTSAEFRDAIFARSEGNPYFTEELLKSLAEEGGLFRDEGGWTRRPIDQLRIPGSVREAVLSRVERLSPEARATLSAAAVIGMSFPFDVLRRVREAPESDVATQLRECVDQQLVVEGGDVAAPSYSFRHALTREVVYEERLLVERRGLHARTAAALADDPAVPPAVLAEHWRLGGDSARAAAAYEAAGRAALAVYAPAEAAAHFDAAIAARGEPTADLYEGLARAYLFFDYPRARDAAEHALALIGDDPEQLERRILLMRIEGRARAIAGDAVGDHELARRAVELVGSSSESPGAALAADWFAATSTRRGDKAAAREWAERARTIARRIGDPTIEASALTSLAFVGAEREPQRAIEMLDQAAALARRSMAAEVMARIHQNGIVQSFSAESERARLVRLERATEFSDRYHYGREVFAAFRAFHRHAAMDWPADGAFGIGGDRRTNLYVAWMQYLEVLVRSARVGPRAEDVDAAAALTELGEQQHEPQWAIPWLSYRGLVLEWAARSGEARDVFARLVRVAGNEAEPDLALTVLGRGTHLTAPLAFLAADRARLDAMRTALEGIESYRGESDALAAFVDALAGDSEAAVAHFVAAAEDFEQRGHRFTIAVDLWALGQRIPLDAPWADTVARVDQWLERAGATWLRREIAVRASA